MSITSSVQRLKACIELFRLGLDHLLRRLRKVFNKAAYSCFIRSRIKEEKMDAELYTHLVSQQTMTVQV